MDAAGSKRSTWRRGWSLPVLAVVAMLAGPLAPDAGAQAMPGTGFQLDRYEPTSAGSWMYSVEHPWYSSTRYFAGGLTFDYGRHPLILRSVDASGNLTGSSSPGIDHEFVAHVDLAFSFLDRVLIMGSLPIALVMSGPFADTNSLGAGVGDPRLGAMVRLYGHPAEDKFSISLGANVWIPIGSDKKLLGDGKIRFMPKLTLGGEYEWLRWAVNFAFLVRSGNTVPGQLGNDLVGNEFQAGLGLQYANKDRTFAVGPEVTFASAFLSNTPTTRSTSMEVLLGLNYLIKDLIMVGVAPGFGALLANGTPDLRILFRIAYAPVSRKAVEGDRDGDGVLDKDDICPDVPKGNHPDPDRLGCPLDDRDHDGVLDKDDVCPDVPKGDNPDPERRGCPLEDRDHDGVPDRTDLCPDVPKGDSPDPDRLGCPLEDRDHDGVPDRTDLCPEVPKGDHPDPDRLGCPIQDRDKDGVMDKDDVCPDVPMGANPDPRPAKKGCPAVDTDGDGIFDHQDVCPTETRYGPNGPDPDPKFIGCPLKKVDPHVVCDAQIKIREQPRFANDKDQVLALKSNELLLDDVASILRQFPTIKKVRVEGHTSKTGAYKHNLDLSNRRAQNVIKWMVANDGVTVDRFVGRGYAWDRHLCGVDVKSGLNRRVEFHIMEEEGCPVSKDDNPPVCPDDGTPSAPAARGKRGHGGKAGGKHGRHH